MPSTPSIIGNFYVGKNLGAGYSGAIYRSTHVHTGQEVALKLQDVNHECPTNRYERNIYSALANAKGMPRLYSAGVQGQWDYLAIELLGSSLDSLWKTVDRQVLPIPTVCEIAMQVIELLGTMHSRGVLHRDIQLGNCTVGLKDPKQIYMIDFGFSKQYIDPRTRKHIPDSRAKRDFIGNYWFSSVRVHCQGRVPSRRDDLEAAALMFIHLLTPNGLSWTRNGVPKTDEASERLKREKLSCRPEDLCRGMPDEFEEFLRYCRKLRFDQTPDYAHWIDRFRDVKEMMGFGGSDRFIWPPPKQVQHPRRGLAPPPPPNAPEMDRLIRNLATMDIAQAAKNPAVVPVPAQFAHIEELSDSDSSVQETSRAPKETKAMRLQRLVKKMGKATDNHSVADVVEEFTDVLTSYTARNLTREAFAFLDVLHKQLSDPSVYMPIRSRSEQSGLDGFNESTQKKWEKLGVVARLRREVLYAPNNKAVAAMVEDFGKVTNRSAGRTVTKDGILFLQGIAEKLRKLQ